MTAPQSAKRVHPGWGWFCIVLGLYPLAIATGVLTVDSADIHAPMWIIFLCGVVFIIAGAMMLVGHDSRINDLFASILLLIMGLVGAWVALFGPADAFSGGIPFLPTEYNIVIARWLFGSGAVVVFAFFVYALHRLFRGAGRRRS
jgi:hypothetical protein